LDSVFAGTLFNTNDGGKMSAIDDAETEPSRKLAAARASIAASALLAVAKLAAGLSSGSLALISEAGHAGVDTLATILTYYAVRAADKPADDTHHYGHGKIESFAALAETGFLFGLALFVCGEALRRLADPDSGVETGWPVFGVLIVSIAIDFSRSRHLAAVAKEEGSEALAADALHFQSDLVSSVLVLIGLVAAHFGFSQGDALGALGVSLFIGVAGFHLGRRTIATLLDTAPRDLAPRLATAIAATPGVIDVDGLRLRTVGAKIIGEASIGVSRTLRIEQAARIKQQVEEAIAREEPNADILVVANPRALDDETVIERIMLVATRRHLAAHHIVVQQIGERLSIGLDIELDGAMPHGRAHALATEFERAIKDEFGADVEIETHIEPLAPHVISGRDAQPETLKIIGDALARHASQNGRIQDTHDVRVRENADGFVVNYHCRVDPALSVAAIHAALDALEHSMREEFPAIVRIIGHAEPDDH
jgi:cation diffusion facilitator family transporter